MFVGVVGRAQIAVYVARRPPGPRTPHTHCEQSLATVELYCGIQQQRFTDRFKYRIDCDSDCLGRALPALLLQPLIENAIKHAVAQRSQPTIVTLAVARNGATLEIELCDDGPGFDPIQPDGDGLRLVRQSLQLAFAARHRFSLTASPEGTRALIAIPAQALAITQAAQVA